jgi:hypothetical protein
MLCTIEFWQHEIKSVCEIITLLTIFQQPISFTVLLYILLLFLFMLSLLFNLAYTIQTLYFETQFVSEESRTSCVVHNINHLRFSLACHLWYLFIYLFIYSFFHFSINSFVHSFIPQSMIYFHNTYFDSILEQIMQQHLKLCLKTNKLGVSVNFSNTGNN